MELVPSLEPLTSTALRGLRAQPPWPRGWRPRTATAGLGTGGFRVGRGAATPIQTLAGRAGGAERGESGKEELRLLHFRSFFHDSSKMNL